MNQILSNLATVKSNPHVAWPVLAAAALQIAKIWLPKYTDQIDETSKYLAFYGIIAAGNSAPQPPKQ